MHTGHFLERILQIHTASTHFLRRRLRVSLGKFNILRWKLLKLALKNQTISTSGTDPLRHLLAAPFLTCVHFLTLAPISEQYVFSLPHVFFCYF